MKYNSDVYLGTFSTNIVIQFFTLVQGVMLARILGPMGRGEFYVITLWPNIFAAVGLLGVNMALARLTSNGKFSGRLRNSAIRISFITAIPTVIICWVLLPYLISDEMYYVLPTAMLFLLFIPINHLGVNLLSIEHGEGNFKVYNLSRSVIYPVFIVGITLVAYFSVDKIQGVIISLIISNVVFVLILLYANKDKFHPLPLPIKTVITESLPYFFSNLLSIVQQQFDKMLVVWLLSPNEIGYYAVAFSVAFIPSVINRSIGLVTFVTSIKSNPDQGFNDLAQSLRRGGCVTFLAIIPFLILLPWLLPLVYGHMFSASLQTTYILVPGVFFAGLSEIVNQALRGHGRPIGGVLSKYIGLILMLIVSLVLIGQLGVQAISIGYTFGEMIGLLAVLYVSIRSYNDASITELIPKSDDFKFILINMRKIVRR